MYIKVGFIANPKVTPNGVPTLAVEKCFNFLIRILAAVKRTHSASSGLLSGFEKAYLLSIPLIWAGLNVGTPTRKPVDF